MLRVSFAGTVCWGVLCTLGVAFVICGLVGCCDGKDRRVGSGEVGRGEEMRGLVVSIAFTGAGLNGVVTKNHFDDVNGNNEEDPGEPRVETTIESPEYVAATGRNVEAFFRTGTRVRVRVRFRVPPELGSVVGASAICAAHPELNLRQVGRMVRVKGTAFWEGGF